MKRLQQISAEFFFNKMENSPHAIFLYDSDRFAELAQEQCEFFSCDRGLIAKICDEGDKYQIYAWLTDTSYCEKLFEQYIADEKCVFVGFTASELPTCLVKYRGAVCFERVGADEGYRDEQIRSLCEKDCQAILDLCAQLKKSGEFAAQEAESFEYIVENKLLDTFLGAFVGEKLVGAIFYRIVDKVKLGVVSELAVSKEFQRQGFGKRLVKCALSQRAGYRYVYHARKNNFKSIALAESCGFTFCGAENVRLKDLSDC